MVELLRTVDFVLLSALKAALAEAGIEAIEFDGKVFRRDIGWREAARQAAGAV